MVNQFQLTARLHKVDVVRYTPAGIPVLDVVLQHHSEQQENGKTRYIQFELPAKILGDIALVWQHKQGEMVVVGGFLAQRSIKTQRPLLHIKSIQEYKG
ncbi:primosomal replication protein N [Neisseriaceae bacterium B1]